MLTGNTSNTSRHSETRQVQAQNDASLLRFLLKAPREVLSQIVSSEMKEVLSSDLFEKRSSEAQTPSEKLQPRELQLLVLNKCILPEERESFLKKALTQANRSNAESDFSSILNPVCREKRTTPYLSKLLETAAWQNQTIAFERLVKTALETDTPLPESTYEWVAECGKPEMLDTLLRETQPDWSEDRQEELKKLAKAQEKTIQRYSEYRRFPKEQALHTAALGMRQPTALENRRDVLALLQTPDIDVNAPNDQGLTPLHLAAEFGRTETVNALLGVPGININAANHFGDTSLHLAALNGRTETVNVLLGAPGINVNTANRTEDTALHLAAQYGRTETVNALLGAPGINVNAANEFGDTALHWAAADGHTETVNALLGAPGINVNAPNERGVTRGVTPLQVAVRRGHAEIVNALRQAGGI
jgi:hypothetical protein